MATATRKPLRFLSPLHKATRQVGVYFEQRMGHTGLLPQEGHLLTYLLAYAPCPIAEVSRVFGIRGSTMTSVLDRLESRALIRRIDNPDDRRSLLLELTAPGKRQAAEIQRWVDELEAAIGGGITASDERGFRKVMAAVEAATNVQLVDRTKRGRGK